MSSAGQRSAKHSTNPTDTDDTDGKSRWDRSIHGGYEFRIRFRHDQATVIDS
jgi:hypothetical protein